jgi:D-alanyl-D-alanine carboxypeptidase (penicillin-binding protein 5/6)
MSALFLNMLRGAGRLLLCATLVFACVETSAAAQSDDTFVTSARAAILVDANTGAVLFAKNADDALPPASMSKLMTLLLAFKAVKDGRVSLETEMEMSVHAWRTGGAPSRTAAMFVPVNTKEKLDLLIQGVAVQSGNDAAIAIAEALAGSEEAFAAQMNNEAEALGLTNSHFANPTGLDDPGQRMSARDLATLARHIIDTYPDLYKYFAQPEFRYRRHRFYNRNPLLREDIGVDGLKTGHTTKAGYGMVVSAKRDGRRLVAVVMGLHTAAHRRSEARRILNWGFSTIEQAKLFDGDDVVGHARLWGGQAFYVPLVGKSDIVAMLPRASLTTRLRAVITYQGPLKAPIHKGDEVATLTVRAQSGSQQEFPLYAAEDIKSSGVVRKGLDAAGFLIWRSISDWLSRQKQALASSAAP